MTFVLDPVWPWGRLYDLLTQVPPGVRFLALVACLAAAALPVFLFRRQRRLSLAAAGVMGASLLFVVRHLWSPAMADAGGFVPGLLWLVGLVLLLLGPCVLAGVSVAAYVGTTNVSRRKAFTLIGLRLLAFLLAIIALARPSLAWTQSSEQTGSVLYVLLDRSRSMTVEDEGSNRSRWRQALRSIDDSDAALTRLKDEHSVSVRWYSFGEELTTFDPAAPGEADGKRTDFGSALGGLFERREAGVLARGLLVISDGGDNGINLPALAEAGRWRGVPCTVHTFSCGDKMTTKKHKDVALTSITTAPTPFVRVNGKLTVTVSADARGFENAKKFGVRLLVKRVGDSDEGGKVAFTKEDEKDRKDVDLPLTVGNEITLSTQMREEGEYHVRVEIERPEGDHFPLNNVIETFATVSKEGVSVLLVDRLRSGEPQAICDVLADDPRFRVTPLWLTGERPAPGSSAAKVFGKDETTPFDVIVLGDVTLDMLKKADDNAPARIAQLVDRGAGLIVLGGLTNLGNGEWKDSPLESLLPVDLTMRDQLEDVEKESPLHVALVPTAGGKRLMPALFGGADDAALERINKESPMKGATRLVAKGPTAQVLARTKAEEKSEPLLIMGLVGATEKGALASRVLVFGGDTTHRWIRDDKSKEYFSRFWRQTAVWLARQEDTKGHVWVRPDVRRIPVRSELGFQVGMRGKGGVPIQGGEYEVKVVTPNGQAVKTPVTLGATENRGTFTSTQVPGTYRVVAKGKGKSPSGEEVDGTAAAWVIVYDEDVEMMRPAADPEFLAKLSAAGGGGEALRVTELPDFLNRLAEKPLERGQERRTLRPNWQTRERSPFLMLFYVAFGVVVSLEWGLRRWWGLK